MAATAEPRESVEAPVSDERRFVLRDVPWSTYVVLRDSLDERNSHVRMTYLEGVLELMSPGRTHEVTTRLITRFIDVWAEEHRIDLRGYRSMTFRDEHEEAGFEPDECFKIGEMPEGGVPDFTIEVTVTSGIVDRMEVFARHRVPEIWEWNVRRRAFAVHRLVDGAYVAHATSALLPALDLELLARFIRLDESHIELVVAYRAALRG
ncbi:MAG TPA: Uma2 family endonuclease [Kofleriaceae bacterium]|jgi:Uma2 family endonuclease